MGFEPTRAYTVGLESTSLDHSDKDALVLFYLDSNKYLIYLLFLYTELTELTELTEPIHHKLFF